ncbi:hypothetical protein KSP40_PGU001594 [Platanthera guangdongensis]|uniref:Uncharacterized protein n=1 Tax=Platanthera guangdongensis TaxID=2320717 RepID=A0ABR2MT58_9ASPA
MAASLRFIRTPSAIVALLALLFSVTASREKMPISDVKIVLHDNDIAAIAVNEENKAITFHYVFELMKVRPDSELLEFRRLLSWRQDESGNQIMVIAAKKKGGGAEHIYHANLTLYPYRHLNSWTPIPYPH